MKLYINANRTGYAPDQIRHTMTVGELIDALCDMTKVVNFEEIPVIEPVKGGTDNDEK